MNGFQLQIRSALYSAIMQGLYLPIECRPMNPKGLADLDNVTVRISQELRRLAHLSCRHTSWASTQAAASTGRLQTRLGAFPHQSPLKFRQGAEHMKDQLATARRGLHLLL